MILHENGALQFAGLRFFISFMISNLRKDYSVAAMTALMVCIRFSASSKTMD